MSCKPSYRKKETTPLAHFVRNSLPHKKLPLFVPQCKTNGYHKLKKPKYIKSRHGIISIQLPITAKAALPTEAALQ